MTNDAYSNMLVAGKTISQTFLANAATRLHPIEWNTGIAAGIAAVMMKQSNLTSRMLYEQYITQLQSAIELVAPLDWTFHENQKEKF